MPRSIAIITDEFSQNILGSRYFLARLAERWQRQGIDVRVTAGCNYIQADIAIMHVDSTVVGDEYLELGRRYPITLNGGVKDILKSSISRYLLSKNDRYEGPVIVKTDANYGGANEFRIKAALNDSTIVSTKIDRPWRKREVMDSLNYPIFARLSEVPIGVWKNDKLIVEKFLPERLDNGEFKGRIYLFFGGQEFAAWFTSPKPVIKSTVASGMGVIDHIPPALRELRKARGFNFGKFDYTEVGGEVVVYDMNKTPTFGPEILGMIPEQKMGGFSDELFEFEP